MFCCAPKPRRQDEKPTPHQAPTPDTDQHDYARAFFSPGILPHPAIQSRAPCMASQDGTVYTGRFEGGRPKGEGTFVFPSGITQQGFYEAVVAEDADEEEPPALLWRGQSVVAC